VAEGEVRETSELVGTLEAPRAAILKPEIDGRVSEILVKEGDRIQSGQAIARLESQDLQAQLQQSQAGLQQALARLAQLQAGSRPEEIAQARSRLAQAQASLRQAQNGSRPEEIAQREAAVNEDQQALRLLQNGTRPEEIAQREAAVNEAQQALQQLQNGTRIEEINQARSQVAQAAAQVRAATAELQKTKIVAPFAGTIGDIPVKVGDVVSQGDELTTITTNDLLELNLSVPLSRSSQLRVGLPVEMIDAQDKAVATGTVSFISPNVDANSQTVLAKATFANVGRQLLDRQFVQARIVWNESSGIVIPVNAVTRIGGKTFAFVAETPAQPEPGQPQLVARQRAVKLGEIQGNNYQVLEGLKPGDKIVTAGLLNLTDGAAIAPESNDAPSNN
jgi:RND family efflux transporter MFP subunit